MKNSRMCSKLGVLAGAAVFCCATGFAQMQNGGGASQGNMQQQNQASQSSMQGMSSMQQGSGNASPADMMFVKNALQGSMAEVQVAQLALQKTSNDQVKQFAQQMVTDHTKLIDQMKPVAQQVGVKVPDGPNKKQKMMMAKLQALSGADFDKAYVQAMVKDHKADDSDFKTEISNGQSPVVKDAATKGDAVVENHLQMIEGIAKGMNLTSGM
jgi:putative membrane protein